MTTVARLMSTEVITVSPETSLREVASILSTEHIGGVPVVSGEETLGVVSSTDLLAFDADAPGSPTERLEQHTGFGESPEAIGRDVTDGNEAGAAYFADYWEDVGADVVTRFEQLEGPEWNVLDEHVASEVMTRSVFSLAPYTDVREAAREMLAAEVHRALVVEDGRVVGIVTSLDVLRAVAERGLG